MIDENRKTMSRRERFVVIAFSLLLCGVCVGMAFYRSSSANVEITVNGSHYRTISLGGVISEYDIHIDADYPVTLHVSREGVRFVDSQCPDKLCEGFGCVPRDSASAVCLPAKVVVRSTKKGEIVYRKGTDSTYDKEQTDGTAWDAAGFGLRSFLCGGAGSHNRAASARCKAGLVKPCHHVYHAVSRASQRIDGRGLKSGVCPVNQRGGRRFDELMRRSAFYSCDVCAGSYEKTCSFLPICRHRRGGRA